AGAPHDVASFPTRRSSDLQRTTLDHSQGVAALAAGLATQLVHEGAHQKDPTSPDTQLAGVEVRDRRDVERIALVEQRDLDGVGQDRKSTRLNSSHRTISYA